MYKFKIDPDENRLQTINRTIRIKSEYFDTITALSEKTGVSFNKIVNQCIAFALENMENEK